jgi:hypothetical protein
MEFFETAVTIGPMSVLSFQIRRRDVGDGVALGPAVNVASGRLFTPSGRECLGILAE